MRSLCRFHRRAFGFRHPCVHGRVSAPIKKGEYDELAFPAYDDWLALRPQHWRALREYGARLRCSLEIPDGKYAGYPHPRSRATWRRWLRSWSEPPSLNGCGRLHHSAVRTGRLPAKPCGRLPPTLTQAGIPAPTSKGTPMPSSLPLRSECECGCHTPAGKNAGMMHIAPCCRPDSPAPADGDLAACPKQAPVAYFVEEPPGQWWQVDKRHNGDAEVTPLYARPTPPKVAGDAEDLAGLLERYAAVFLAPALPDRHLEPAPHVGDKLNEAAAHIRSTAAELATMREERDEARGVAVAYGFKFTFGGYDPLIEAQRDERRMRVLRDEAEAARLTAERDLAAAVVLLNERAQVACDAECDGDRGLHDAGCARVSVYLLATLTESTNARD